MRKLSLSGYAFVFLWSAWLFALQGFLASAWLGAWTPDLGLVLLLALDARLETAETRRAALLVALARATFSADAPAALVAGYLAVTGITRALRGGLEIDGFLPRAILAAGLAGALAAWWMLCYQLAQPGVQVAIALVDLWPTAVASGTAALVFTPLAIRLPGFASIRRRRR